MTSVRSRAMAPADSARPPHEAGHDRGSRARLVTHHDLSGDLAVPTAVSLVYAGGVPLGRLAIVMSRTERVTGFILVGFVLAGALTFGMLLERVPVYVTSKRRRLMISEVISHTKSQFQPATDKATPPSARS